MIGSFEHQVREEWQPADYGSIVQELSEDNDARRAATITK